MKIGRHGEPHPPLSVRRVGPLGTIAAARARVSPRSSPAQLGWSVSTTPRDIDAQRNQFAHGGARREFDHPDARQRRDREKRGRTTCGGTCDVLLRPAEVRSAGFCDVRSARSPWGRLGIRPGSAAPARQLLTRPDNSLSPIFGGRERRGPAARPWSVCFDRIS
jgi:hypothetical protein